eukprot:scaffold7.g3574.t1
MRHFVILTLLVLACTASATSAASAQHRRHLLKGGSDDATSPSPAPGKTDDKGGLSGKSKGADDSKAPSPAPGKTDDKGKKPKPTPVAPTLYEATAAKSLTVLGKLIDKVPGAVRVLSDPRKPLTLLAPDDAAFKALADQLRLASVDDLLGLDVKVLAKILSYHLINRRFATKDWPKKVGKKKALPTLLPMRKLIAVTGDGGALQLDGRFSDALVKAGAENRDLVAGRGIVQIVDAVLLPVNPATLAP